MNSSALVTFVREPIPGKVKTRLASTIGDHQACEVYKELLSYTLKTMVQTGFPVHVWLTEDSQSDFLLNSDYPQDLNVSLQIKGDLGEKMKAMFDDLFSRGFEKIVLIGSDCPVLHKDHLIMAMQSLSEHDVTLGPTEDGGYYLIGQKSLSRNLFEGVSWSSQYVWDETCQKLEMAQINYFALPKLYDLDTVEELKRFSKNYSGDDPHLIKLCQY